jgi:hypothetical protein
MKVCGWIGGDKPCQLLEGAARRITDGFLAHENESLPELEWIDTLRKSKRLPSYRISEKRYRV